MSEIESRHVHVHVHVHVVDLHLPELVRVHDRLDNSLALAAEGRQDNSSFGEETTQPPPWETTN
jgi:hypothetical protein